MVSNLWSIYIPSEISDSDSVLSSSLFSLFFKTTTLRDFRVFFIFSSITEATLKKRHI